MGGSELVTFFEDNWAVIEAVPWVIVAIAVVLAGIIYFLVRATFSLRLTNLESTLALKESEISDYQRRLDGASPAEAQAEMISLREGLETLETAFLGVVHELRSRPEPPEIDALKHAYVTILPNGLIGENDNITSVADNGASSWTVNFDEPFKTDLYEIVSIGVGSPKIRIESKAPSSARVTIEADFVEPVKLWFRELPRTEDAINFAAV